MRIIHASFGVALACLLSACNSSAPTHQVDLETIKAEATAIVATTEAAIAAYAATNPVPPAVSAKIAVAEAAAEAVVAGLPSKTPTDVPQAVADVVVVVDQLVAALPPNVLPKQTMGAIAAFEVLAKYLPALLQPVAATSPPA